MRPSEVLDAMADLAARLGTEAFADYIAVCAHGKVDHGNQEFVDLVRRDWPQVMRLAYAYHVSPDMTALVAAAAAGLDESDLWDRDLAPTAAGFVRFDAPLLVTDVRGSEMKINYLVWAPGGRVGLSGRVGTVVLAFNDHDADPDEVAGRVFQDMTPDERDTVRTALGRWGWVGLQAIPDGATLGPAVVVAANLADDAMTIGTKLDGPIHPATNVKRLLHALWLLLDQTLVDVHSVDVDRHTRKRMARHALPQRVVTIALRRVKHAPTDGDSADVRYSHRWMVRGHWRWQVCGEGRRDRKRIWISEYVKGPDGAPLFISQKVYDLRR